ncbi:uncharacterized protein K444DRAFT_596730 [Hyaloscypha bicolor E]|uniref:Protein kinase domain-containing protein n=1 Tax=Hyaloscypha bicolor E TaxID=1095630 RepID=A0A2J6SW04_9HELO|nr:uncharacterized protein K444DRAFT_596730 [Hyaloscypha bicolor E]PMD54947.1 hypothetical protein K444DRAFT_596730 [Hyaloscypha bicolor E]
MAPFVEGFHPGNIPSIVTGLRNDGTAASFCLGTADRPLAGKECVIYAVQFPDAATWAVRIPVHASHLPPESITNFVETEVSILKRLQTSGFSRSPRLLGYNSGFDNPIGFPYLVLSWFEGTQLEWSDTIPPQRESRNKIIRQMVDIILELADCTKELRTGTSASKYLVEFIDRKIVRVSIGQMPELQLRDCFIQRALVSRVVHPDLENSPFLISHEDLAPQNIIVDSEYNIKGIIDWGFARLLPLQFAVGFPRFLAIEPVEIDAPRPPDVVSFSSAFLQASPVLQIDRQNFISYLSSRSPLVEPSPPSRTISLTQSIKLVLSASDIDWRRLLFEAASSKGLHKWMAKRSWLLHGTENEWSTRGNSLVEEVDGFLAGEIGQKSGLSWEILVDAIKI